MLVNANQYPEHGILIPLKSIIRTSSNSEGSSYTAQANSEQFNGNVSSSGMLSSTVVDADHIDSTYQMRKLNALQQLKTGNCKTWVRIGLRCARSRLELKGSSKGATGTATEDGNDLVVAGMTRW
ncbi:hypothetical protein F5051DRAFT_447275 [Lentinula edodes]|nr:hypothetical protein F5051DRAFT_447275 [Lentinula edodes]